MDVDEDSGQTSDILLGLIRQHEFFLLCDKHHNFMILPNYSLYGISNHRNQTLLTHLPASDDLCHLLIPFENGSKQDQAQSNARWDLDLKCLTL